jgi:annexin A7/11
LEKELKKELSGNFERVIIALITTPANFLAQELRDAVSGMGTNEGRLIEILCPSTNYEIQEIRDAYFVLYNKHLENDIKGDTAGPFKSLMVSLLQVSSLSTVSNYSKRLYAKMKCIIISTIISNN